MQGDTVYAFGVVLFSEQVAYPLYVGVDYDLNAEYDLYFNAMYAMLQISLKRGVQLVSWGQTTDEFKRDKLSCYQTPRHFFIKGTNWLIATAIDLLFDQLFPKRVINEKVETQAAQRRAAWFRVHASVPANVRKKMRSVAEVCEKLVDVSENIGTIGKLKCLAKR